jgi:hypothetical protein
VIERARARLAANAARSERNQALVQRVNALTERVQARSSRQLSTPGREAHLWAEPVTPADVPSLSAGDGLRRKFIETILKVADVEERIARNHESLAELQPDKAPECRRIAEEATEQARRAREMARQLGG